MLTDPDVNQIDKHIVSNHNSPILLLNQIHIISDTQNSNDTFINATTNCYDCDEMDLTTTSLPPTHINSKQKRWNNDKKSQTTS